MPTRIVVQERAAAAASSDASPNAGGNEAFTPTGSSPAPRFGLTRQAAKSLSSRNLGKNRRANNSGHGGDEGLPRPASPSVTSGGRHLSKRDIVASPRLLGYMLNFIASLICMVSAVKFEKNSQPSGFLDIVYDGLQEALPDEAAANANNPSNRYLSNEEGETISKDRARRVSMADAVFKASIYFDVALIVGGPEPRIFNPYGARFLQSQDDIIESELNQSIRDNGIGFDSNNNTVDVAQNISDTDFLPSTMEPTVAKHTSSEASFAPTQDDVPRSKVPTLEPTQELSSSSSSPTRTTMPTSSSALVPTQERIPTNTFIDTTDMPTQESDEISTGIPSPSNGRNDTNDNEDQTVASPSFSSQHPAAPSSLLDSTSTLSPSPTITISPSSTSIPSGKPSTDAILLPGIRAVDYWKMWAAIALPAVGCAAVGFIIAVHFDNTFFPDIWREAFQDASNTELYIIWALILYWIAGLYVCTGVDSVGYVQANVFFSAWAAFGTSIMNYKLWREGAEKRSLLQLLGNHSRMTTYNWFWVLIFSTITFFSLLDLYVHRNSSSTLLGLSLESISPKTWRRLWIITGVTTGLSVVVPLTNHILTRPQTDNRDSLRKFRIAFRGFEGIVLLAMLGMYAYIITNYTGAESSINGINNPYLGTWGTFLCIILAFSTWLRDKKNVAWVHDVESDVILSSLTPRKLRKSKGRSGGNR